MNCNSIRDQQEVAYSTSHSQGQRRLERRFSESPAQRGIPSPLSHLLRGIGAQYVALHFLTSPRSPRGNRAVLLECQVGFEYGAKARVSSAFNMYPASSETGSGGACHAAGSEVSSSSEGPIHTYTCHQVDVHAKLAFRETDPFSSCKTANT